MPAEKPGNNQKAALQNTVMRKNELLKMRCCCGGPMSVSKSVFILQQCGRKEPLALLFVLAKSK